MPLVLCLCCLTLRISPLYCRAYMLLYRVRLDEWRSGSLTFLCIMWILAGIGDPLPDLEDHSLAFGLVQDSPTSTDMTVTPTNSTATACETFVSDPTPTPTPLRRTSSHCLYPNRYYLGLESPAGLRWLQSPAITTMPGRSSTKKRVCQPDVSEVDSDPTPSPCN